MKGFKDAVRFLTVFNLDPGTTGEMDTKDAAEALPFFPVTGLIVGAVSAAVVLALSLFFDSTIVLAAFATAAIAVLSRGLHLDGIGDCFDGLHYTGNRKKAVEAMKDKTVGAFGTAAIAVSVVGKTAALSSVSSEMFLSALVAVPALARFGSVIVSFTSESISESRLGSLFSSAQGNSGILGKSALASLIIAVLLCGAGGVGIFILMSLLAFALTIFFKSAFGGSNGDVHGAVIEICELFGFAIAGGIL